MKSARAAVQDYETDLPLDISVLELRLVRNIDVAASTITDEQLVITEDGDDEDKI